MFGDNTSIGFVYAITFDLITPNGGHGQRVHTIGPKVKEFHYILVDNIIYKWEEEDYSDLQEYLIFDSKKDIIQSIDKRKTYNPEKNE